MTEIADLDQMGVQVLPVSEVENLFLLPNVIEAIALSDGHQGQSIEELRDQILDELFDHAAEARNRRDSILRYVRRRIDRTLKKVDLSDARDAATLAADYAAKTAALDIARLAQTAQEAIDEAISNRDAMRLLKWHDNKGMLAIAAKAKGCTKDRFTQWIMRALRNGSSPQLSAALAGHLPTVTPH